MSKKRVSTSTADHLDELLAHQLDPAGPEYRVVRFRRHARRLAIPVLVLFALAAAVPYFAGSFPEEWQNLALYAGSALAFVVIVVAPFLSWLARTTTVTTKRIILRSGVFTRHRTELPIGQIRELKLKRGLIQRMFGSGDIVLQMAQSDPYVLKHVPLVKTNASALQELVEWHYSAAVWAGGGYGAGGYAAGDSPRQMSRA